MTDAEPVLHRLLEDAASAAPERTAVEIEDATATYADLDRRANRVAHLVADLGIDPDGTVLVFLPNRIEYVSVLFGLAKAGVVAALVDTEYRGEGLDHLIGASEADLAIVGEDLLDTYAGRLEGLENPPPGLLVVGAEASAAVPEGVTIHGCFGDRIADQPADRPDAAATVDPPETLHLVHTSGTTGLPKWCRLSHAAIVHQARYWADLLGIRSDDHVMNPLPLYHLNPLSLTLYPAVSKRATVVLSEAFSASRFWDRVHDRDVTVLVLIFSVVDILLNRDVEAAPNDVRVMFPPDRTFLERFDVPEAAGLYGSTETAGSLTGRRFSRPFPETDEALSQLAGWPRPDFEVAILDEGDERVPPGELGEIACRPAKPDRLFDEYYNMPQETVEAVRNLWYHTGDLGYLDEAGQLHFVQRKAESIRVKDEFVNVELVERALEAHPAVREAAVVGVPAEVGGEAVAAFLTTAAGAEIDPAAIRDHAAGEVPEYMLPQYVSVIDSFPRTGTQKIRKTALTDRDLNEAWDAQTE